MLYTNNPIGFPPHFPGKVSQWLLQSALVQCHLETHAECVNYIEPDSAGWRNKPHITLYFGFALERERASELFIRGLNSLRTRGRLQEAIQHHHLVPLHLSQALFPLLFSWSFPPWHLLSFYTRFPVSSVGSNVISIFFLQLSSCLSATAGGCFSHPSDDWNYG